MAKIKPKGIWVNGRWLPPIKGGQVVATTGAGGSRSQGK